MAGRVTVAKTESPSPWLPSNLSSWGVTVLLLLQLLAGYNIQSSAAFVMRPSTIPMQGFHTTRKQQYPPAHLQSSPSEEEGDDDANYPDDNATTVPAPVLPLEPTTVEDIPFSTTTPLPPAESSMTESSPTLTTLTTTYSPLDDWHTHIPTWIQGGSIRTWTFDPNSFISTIQVHLKTDGRPMNANVELWSGPDNTPQKLAVYVEDGKARPVVCFLNTPPLGSTNSVSVRNTAQLEYPLQAVLEPSKLPRASSDVELAVKVDRLVTSKPKTVQGGAVLTIPLTSETRSVQVLLQTERRPLNARIELLSGPNNVKQVMEVYCEDGKLRPFYSIIQTPGVGNVIRIVNTATVEFPLTVMVVGWDVDALVVEKGASTKSEGVGSRRSLLEMGGTKEWDSNFFEENSK